MQSRTPRRSRRSPARRELTRPSGGPGADPHLYEADVASALAAAQARLVIANGAGYDDFMSQLLGATVNAGRVALSVQAVLGAYGPDVNPHLWYDIPRVPQVAAAIEAALARLDPPDATVFTANLAAFDASLRPVEAVIATRPGSSPRPRPCSTRWEGELPGAAVRLRDATLRFGRRVVWDGLDLDIAPGECLAVLGPQRGGQDHAAEGAAGPDPAVGHHLPEVPPPGGQESR